STLSAAPIPGLHPRWLSFGLSLIGEAPSHFWLVGLSGSTTDASHLGALTSGCERPKWRFSGFL
ncbi:MAG: hypothetical protein ACPG4V_13340, partial [Limisphaerales bacterium]